MCEVIKGLVQELTIHLDVFAVHGIGGVFGTIMLATIWVCRLE